MDLTETARREIVRKAGLENRKPAIRLGLRGGGCSGYSYVLEWDDPLSMPGLRDEVFLFDEVRVVIDRKSLSMMRGTVVNYVMGVQGHGFKFDNPNVKSVCGCGESVEVK